MGSLYKHVRSSYQKVPAIGTVMFRSSEKTYSGYLVNICKEGLMLKARELPDPDEEITLSFQLLHSNHLYHLKAFVLWVSPNRNPNFLNEMGARFVDLGSEDRRHINQHIDKFYTPQLF